MLSAASPAFPNTSYHLPRHSPHATGSHRSGHLQSAPQAKKRKTDRACDACRRKKTRCDGPWSLNNVCSNCKQTKKQCTYLEASKPRGPPKAYVTGLEDRVEELEALLAQIRPNTDFSNELGPPVIRDSWKGLEDREPGHGVTNSNPESPSTSRPNTPPLSKGPPPSSAPTALPLPPLMIPFHRPKNETTNDAPSTSSRTTHLLFKSRRGLEKRKSGRTSSFVTSSDPDSDCASSEESSSSEEDVFETSARGRSRFGLGVNETPMVQSNIIRFHGRNSTASLVEVTRKFKHMHMQDAMKMDTAEETTKDVKNEKADTKGKGTKIKAEGPDNSRVAMARRFEFWATPPWEKTYASLNSSSPVTAIPHILAQFPPPDLCRTLIKLYFFHSNNYFPLLHKPTFDRQWEERLYERNVWHACLCLMVFAVASRWCEDERVLDESDQVPSADDEGETKSSNSKSWITAGWRYFQAGSDIHRLARSIFHPSTLFEVQSFTLMGMFLRGARFSPTAWLVVSLGLRKAQDVGAHRKSIYRTQPNADDELWKRAFWHLVVFDRIGGATLGRSPAIGEEDFDIDLPLEVDDEYWTGPSAWKQPGGVPSIITGFNQFIKLTQIVTFTTKTVYALNKQKIFRGLIEGDWRVELVTQLNTAMEEWVNSVPGHLKWSEDIPNVVFFTQSAMLYTTYHLTRMLIYRPFIPAPPLLPPSLKRDHKEPTTPSPLSPLPFPALAVCITSARSCAVIVEAQLRKRSWDYIHIPGFANAAFTCAGTLILALWDLKAQQKVLIKVKNAGVINPPKPSEIGTLNMPGSTEDSTKTESLLLALQQKMEQLASEVKLFLDALEWLKDRWECVHSMLSRLKEALPSPEDLSCESELASQPNSLTIVKHMSFQDLRRQRQQMKQEKELPRDQLQSRDPNISPVDPSSSQLPPQWPLPPESQNDPAIRSAHPTRDGLRSFTESGREEVDVNRFLQEHYSNLHTFADDDFDPSHEGPIQLPTIPYHLSANHHEHGRPPADSTMIRHHPPRCSCPDCMSPSRAPAGDMHASRDHHQQSHYSNPPYRDPAQPRPPSVATFSFQSPTPFISNSMRRASVVNLSVNDFSARDLSMRRPSADGHIGIPRRQQGVQQLSPMPQQSQMNGMSPGLSASGPVSSLDMYHMHDQRQSLATSNERGSYYDDQGPQNKFPYPNSDSLTEQWKVSGNPGNEIFAPYTSHPGYRGWQQPPRVPQPHMEPTTHSGSSSHVNTPQIQFSDERHSFAVPQPYIPSTKNITFESTTSTDFH